MLTRMVSSIQSSCSVLRRRVAFRARNPNFQNMPRGNTFAIRKVVESRFPGGFILEGDYSQLEFRVAGFLAKDSQAYLDVRRVQMFTAILQVLSDAADKKQRHIPSNLYTAVSPERHPNNATTEPLRRSMKVLPLA